MNKWGYLSVILNFLCICSLYFNFLDFLTFVHKHNEEEQQEVCHKDQWARCHLHPILPWSRRSSQYVGWRRVCPFCISSHVREQFYPGKYSSPESCITSVINLLKDDWRGWEENCFKCGKGLCITIKGNSFEILNNQNNYVKRKLISNFPNSNLGILILTLH